MGYCKADDAQICEDCGALIADGYWPEHTRFHEVVTSLSLDALKRLKQLSGERPGERSLMDDLPPEVRPLAAAIGIPDRPVDLRERAREWIAGFLAASDEDRVNCVALMLGAADDALRCAMNHKDAEPAELAGLPSEVCTLVHAVDRLRDEWVEADVHARYELWMAVHDASDAVYKGPYRETSIVKRAPDSIAPDGRAAWL